MDIFTMTNHNRVLRYLRANMTAWLLTIVLYISLTEAKGCVFQPGWFGRWYQSGLGEVIIKHNSIGDKGVCKSSQKDRFLIENKKDKCHSCLLLMQRHRNIIQYKESYCLKDKDSLEKVCSSIDPYDPLYTLVREGASPVRCPFNGQFTFTYKNIDGGECENPQSDLTVCAGVGRFKFNFATCPVVSESLTRYSDFECLATWKVGSETYFYGGFTGSDAADREDIYRCFMYKAKGANMLDYSMSVDASCRGLMTPQEGPLMVTMTTAADWRTPECIFPQWFRRIRWRDLQGTHYYHGNPMSANLIDVDYRRHQNGRGHTVTTFRCMRAILMTSKEFVVSSLTSHGCENKYQCLKLKKRNDQVIEIHQGKHEHDPTSCPDEVFDQTKTITLIPKEMHTTACPFPGHYDVIDDRTASPQCTTTVQSGCNKTSAISFDDSCVPQQDSLECLSHWEEDDKQFVIARSPPVGTHPPVANCYVFANEGENLKFATDTSCNPHIEKSHIMEYLLKSQPEPCAGTGAAGYFGSDLNPFSSSASSIVSTISTYVTITLLALEFILR